MPETQWMTLLETADMMQRLPNQVTQMCEDGKLEYYMEDGRYFVSRESIDLFMHPLTGGPALENPDANGTSRRRYGRAPDDIEPSPESATGSETVNGRDEVDAAGEEAGEIMEEASARDDKSVETAESEEPVEDVTARVDEEPEEDVEKPEFTGHLSEDESQMAPDEDGTRPKRYAARRKRRSSAVDARRGASRIRGGSRRSRREGGGNPR